MIDSEKEQSYESRHEFSDDEEHRDTKQSSEHEPSEKPQNSDHEYTSDGEESSPKDKEASGTQQSSEDEEQSSLRKVVKMSMGIVHPQLVMMKKKLRITG